MESFTIDENQELILEDGKYILYKNGVAVRGAPKSIYKYYSLNEKNIDALENSYFFLSNPKDFNDPFDCNFNLITEKQNDFIDGFPAPILNDVINKGISCFSTHGMHPLMWGHYAKAFQGFVLEFNPHLDIVKSDEMNSQNFLRVIYSKSPNSISSASTFSNIYQLIVKLDHWSYENEWRLIVDKKNLTMNKIHYAAGSIKSISFGYQMHDFNKGEGHNKLREKLIAVLKNKFPNTPQFIVGPDAKRLELKRLPLYEVKDIQDLKIVLK